MQVGDVSNNLNRADAVLSKANPKDLDLLVLPELAFTGSSQGLLLCEGDYSKECDGCFVMDNQRTLDSRLLATLGSHFT